MAGRELLMFLLLLHKYSYHRHELPCLAFFGGRGVACLFLFCFQMGFYSVEQGNLSPTVSSLSLFSVVIIGVNHQSGFSLFSLNKFHLRKKKSQMPRAQHRSPQLGSGRMLGETPFLLREACLTYILVANKITLPLEPPTGLNGL